MRRLVQLAYPTASQDILDVLGKDQFIDALDDSEIRWRVYQIKTRTLDDAVCAAVEMEAYKKAESQRSHFRKPVRRLNCDDKTAAPDKSTDLNQLRSQVDQLNTLMAQLLEGPKKDRFKKFPNRKLECWNCGREGDLRRDCPKPMKFPQKGHSSN